MPAHARSGWRALVGSVLQPRHPFFQPFLYDLSLTHVHVSRVCGAVQLYFLLPECASPLSAFEPGTSFEPVLADELVDSANVTEIVLCSGKLFYELAQEREKRGASHVAFVRIEQLAPFPYDALESALARYPEAAQRNVRWCQEEPQNQGAWTFVESRLNNAFGERS